MTERTAPGLLVSVVSAEEAATAIEAGADLLDVKDPNRGPLGMAHHEAVAAVIQTANGQVPVSAALGEWSSSLLTDAHWHLELDIDFIKWGLAGYPGGPAWGEELLETRREIPATMEVVCVAYADWQKANSPPLQEVVRFAKRFRFRNFLLDTFVKDGQALTDILTTEEIAGIVDSLHAGGVAVALGGSLTPDHAKKMGAIRPDWYAVRGSVCAGGKRDGLLDPVRIRKWKEVLAG